MQSSHHAVLKALGFLLIAVAVVGKLAFLTISKHQASDPAVLLQKSGGLQATLAHLESERAGLKQRIEAVSEAEHARKERRVELLHNKEMQIKKEKLQVQHDKQVLAAERKDKAILEQGLDSIRGVGTRTDEAMFNMIMKDHSKEQQLLRAHARKAEKQAVDHLGEQKLRIEADLVAKSKLRKDGIIPKDKPMAKVLKTVRHHETLRELRNKARNDELAAENTVLSKEIKQMRAKIQHNKEVEYKKKMAQFGGSDTFGSQLAKAGVVLDSWGPMTSDAGTRPDPRDSFAKEPKSMMPRPVKPFHMPHIKAPKTEGQLEKEMGFKSSILYSNSFNKEW